MQKITRMTGEMEREEIDRKMGFAAMIQDKRSQEGNRSAQPQQNAKTLFRVSHWVAVSRGELSDLLWNSGEPYHHHNRILGVFMLSDM